MASFVTVFHCSPVPDGAAGTAVTSQAVAVVVHQRVSQVLHRVGILGEHQHRPAIVSHLAEDREECIAFRVAGAKSIQVIEQPVDLLLFPPGHLRVYPAAPPKPCRQISASGRSSGSIASGTSPLLMSPS